MHIDGKERKPTFDWHLFCQLTTKRKTPNRVLFRFGEVTCCEERNTSPPAASVLGHDSGWRLQKIRSHKRADFCLYYSLFIIHYSSFIIH